MVTKLMELSAISVGVHESTHTVRTVCPHCGEAHSVVIAASKEEQTAMQKTLERLTNGPSPAKATYRTRTKIKKPRKTTETHRQVSVKAPRARSEDNGQGSERISTRPVTPAHLLRPRFRYYAADRRKNPNLLSPTRRRIYNVVAKFTERGTGVVEADLLKKGFPHGTIQQTMHWLREHGWVKHEKELPSEHVH